MSARTTPTPPTGPTAYRTAPWSSAVGALIFTSRWLQAPLYLGLIVAQAIYVWVFLKELWHLIDGVFIDQEHVLGEADIMLIVLGLIDVVMIANLLIMVIIGGYETFVSRIRVDGHPDQPEWLSHVNANVLKVKLAMAIVGISSIHLLKTFIGVGALGSDKASSEYTGEGVMWQVIIHCVFILSALALALIDRMSYHKVAAGETHDGVAVPVPVAPAPSAGGSPEPDESAPDRTREPARV